MKIVLEEILHVIIVPVLTRTRRSLPPHIRIHEGMRADRIRLMQLHDTDRCTGLLGERGTAASAASSPASDTLGRVLRLQSTSDQQAEEPYHVACHSRWASHMSVLSSSK